MDSKKYLSIRLSSLNNRSIRPHSDSFTSQTKISQGYSFSLQYYIATQTVFQHPRGVIPLKKALFLPDLALCVVKLLEQVVPWPRMLRRLERGSL